MATQIETPAIRESDSPAVLTRGYESNHAAKKYYSTQSFQPFARRLPVPHNVRDAQSTAPSPCSLGNANTVRQCTRASHPARFPSAHDRNQRSAPALYGAIEAATSEMSRNVSAKRPQTSFSNSNKNRRCQLGLNLFSQSPHSQTRACIAHPHPEIESSRI